VITLTAADTALLREALDDAWQFRASHIVARLSNTVHTLDDTDNDADTATAYRHLLAGIEEATATATVEKATVIELEPEEAHLAAEALNDGAAWIGAIMIGFAVTCGCCTARSIAYQTLGDHIAAGLSASHGERM
jgi:hypothetical protein